MIKLSTAQLWVHDQDEALAFYTNKLGMEVRSDVTLAEMGDFRWLTVGPPGQPDISVVLMAIPGPPVMDVETAELVRTLMAKGFAGTIFLTRISTQLLRPRQLNSKWRRRPCHQGTVVSAGRLAWRRRGEYARRSMRTVIWSPLMLMVPELSRKRRWRVSGVAVA